MQLHDEERYDQWIADYLDGKMTEEEEIAFMEQVSADAALRQRYEQQIDLAWQVEKEEVPIANAGTMVAPLPGSTAPPSNWHYWAAAAVLLLAASIYWLRTKPTVPDVPVAKVAVDTVPTLKADTDQPKRIVGNDLFGRYYQRYAGSDKDPLVLSVVLQQYQQGKHAFVQSAIIEDFQLMGSTTEEEQTRLYLQLYKALSLLDTGSPGAADDLKKLAGQRTEPMVAATATWYAALAYLRQGDTSTCKTMLLQGRQLPNWLYKTKADQLLASL